MTHAARRRMLLCGLAATCCAACAAPPAGSPAAEAPALGGADWRLVELDGQPLASVAARQPPTLRFDPATGRVSGATGVNRIGGPYRLQGQQLTLGPLAGTRMAGPPDAMALEDAVLAMLGRVAGAQVRQGRLALVDAGGRVLARFEPAAP